MNKPREQAWGATVRNAPPEDSPSLDRLALERVYDLATRALTSTDLISTPHGELFLNFLGSLMQFEREERAEQTQATCDHKFIDSVRCVKCRWMPPVGAGTA